MTTIISLGTIEHADDARGRCEHVVVDDLRICRAYIRDRDETHSGRDGRMDTFAVFPAQKSVYQIPGLHGPVRADKSLVQDAEP